MNYFLDYIKPGKVTMLSRSFANRVIQRINALVGMEIQRGGSDKVFWSDGKVVLQIKKSAGGATEKVLYIRVCNRDGSEYYIPFVVAGDAVLEADIPAGAEIYDPS